MGKAARLVVIRREQHGLANKEARPVQTHKPAGRTGCLEECEVFKLRSDVHQLFYSGPKFGHCWIHKWHLKMSDECYCIRNTKIKQVATANK